MLSKLLRNNLLRRFIDDAAGFTLMEVVVAIGLLSLAVSMVGAGIFQTIRTEASWQDGVVATKDLRHVGSRFGGDVLGSKRTDLVDGVPAATVMLTTHINYQITYSKNLQDELVRSHFDGVATTYENRMATKVKTVIFESSGDVITMTLEVYSVGTDTKTMVLRSTLR